MRGRQGDEKICVRERGEKESKGKAREREEGKQNRLGKNERATRTRRSGEREGMERENSQTRLYYPRPTSFSADISRSPRPLVHAYIRSAVRGARTR